METPAAIPIPTPIVARVSPTKEEAVKEVEMAGENIVSSYPGIVMTPNGNGNGGNHGLEGKDATFIHEGFNAGAQRDIVTWTQEGKFQGVVASKENAILSERLTRENERHVDSVRREIMAAVKAEGAATRELMVATKIADQAAQIADLKAQLLKKS